ncbi:MAG: DUF899 family protein [SAR324 cluster bacterium]|nr:DUF899 family protein [SAR324 cluster bacterium]
MHPYPVPGESPQYGKQRDALLEAEMALRDQRERVAELRRQLPAGPVVRDYVFREGPPDLSENDPAQFFDTRLSELFAPGKDTLTVVHFMFAPDWEQGCPMCTMWADGYNAVIEHLTQRTNFAVVARAEIGKFRDYVRARGWRNLRLLSSHDNTFTGDIGMEKGEEQLPGVSLFTRQGDGTIRHIYTTGAIQGEGQYRGMDLLSPVWHFFDLLPEGRGDWWPKHAY